ncbi:MAG: hypothetical protein AB7F43_02405 [Bacteriovoracia bacterium]
MYFFTRRKNRLQRGSVQALVVATLAIVSISTIRVAKQVLFRPVPIRIGSQLKLSKARFTFAHSSVSTLSSPDVKTVAVKMPVILVPTEEPAVISGVAKQVIEKYFDSGFVFEDTIGLPQVSENLFAAAPEPVFISSDVELPEIAEENMPPSPKISFSAVDEVEDDFDKKGLTQLIGESEYSKQLEYSINRPPSRIIAQVKSIQVKSLGQKVNPRVEVVEPVVTRASAKAIVPKPLLAFHDVRLWADKQPLQKLESSNENRKSDQQQSLSDADVVKVNPEFKLSDQLTGSMVLAGLAKGDEAKKLSTQDLSSQKGEAVDQQEVASGINKLRGKEKTISVITLNTQKEKKVNESVQLDKPERREDMNTQLVNRAPAVLSKDEVEQQVETSNNLAQVELPVTRPESTDEEAQAVLAKLLPVSDNKNGIEQSNVGEQRIVTLIFPNGSVQDRQDSKAQSQTENIDVKTAKQEPEKKQANDQRVELNTEALAQHFAKEMQNSATAVDREKKNEVLPFSGQILEAFTSGRQPVVGARIQILGTDWTTTSDEEGYFSFSEFTVNGVLPVLISKEGYLKRRIDLKEKQQVQVELLSQNSAQVNFLALGVQPDPDSAFLFGQLVSSAGENVDGLSIELLANGEEEHSGQAVPIPVFFDAQGAPDTALHRTSHRGQFLFVNVRPGTYLLKMTDAFGQSRASHIVHLSANEGVVRKYNTGSQKLIEGKVSLENQGIAGALVKMLGSQFSVKTDPNGEYHLGPIYVDCGELSYLEVVSPNNAFRKTRADFVCSNMGVKESKRDIFVYSNARVDSLSEEAGVASSGGTILGHVSFNRSVKMQLWGPDEADTVFKNPSAGLRGKDFYFSKNGMINENLNRTTRNGFFMILDAPSSLSYIQAFDKNNNAISFWPILTESQVVNVYNQ